MLTIVSDSYFLFLAKSLKIIQYMYKVKHMKK